MESFSERNGYVPKKEIQLESMDEALRTRIWNLFYASVFMHKDSIGFVGENRELLEVFNLHICTNFLILPIDSLSLGSIDVNIIRDKYSLFKWYQVYDFLEFVFDGTKGLPFVDHKSFISGCNNILSFENSAYRIVNDLVSPITSKTEIEAVEDAIQNSPDSARTHIETALAHLSNRQNPDYRNSFKESISAVESIAKHIAKDKNATLSDALKIIGKEAKLHPALIKGYDKIYGYASDAGGVRHGSIDLADVNQNDARYFLVSCSAFVNYLTEKAREAGIIS